MDDNNENLMYQLIAAQKAMLLLNGGAQPPRPRKFQKVEHEPCLLTLKQRKKILEAKKKKR